MSNKPTVVSLFAGGGGSSLGYRMAGFEERLAVEFDANAVEVLKKNFPQVPIYAGDIMSLTSEQALKLSGLKPGELDVLDGSPPCQGFSTAGRRIMNDPRNQLFREYVRMLQTFRPRAMVFENVTGLVKGKMILVFNEIVKEIEKSGYRTVAAVLNAAKYGVPQARRRVLIIGTRKGEAAPSFPDPVAGPPAISMDVFKSVKSSREDLKWAEEIVGDRTGKALVSLMRTGQDGGDYHPDGNWFSFKRIDPLRPAFTIPKMIAKGMSNMLHPWEPRNITIAEAKALSSFPQDFELLGNPEEQWARIGNCVPPLLIKAVAEHLKTSILNKPKKG